jgi:hypothetical protein
LNSLIWASAAMTALTILNSGGYQV